MLLRTFIVVLLSGTITLAFLAQEKAKLRVEDFVGAQRESAARNPEGVALFVWRPYNEGEYVAEKEKLFREVSEFLADRGMKLSR